MQDVVSLEEGIDEACEVSPISKMLSISPSSSIDMNSPLSPTTEVLSSPRSPSRETGTAAEIFQAPSNSTVPSSGTEYSSR